MEISEKVLAVCEGFTHSGLSENYWLQYVILGVSITVLELVRGMQYRLGDDQ